MIQERTGHRFVKALRAYNWRATSAGFSHLVYPNAAAIRIYSTESGILYSRVYFHATFSSIWNVAELYNQCELWN